MSSFGEAAIEAATSRYEYGDERKAHIEGWHAALSYLERNIVYAINGDTQEDQE